MAKEIDLREFLQSDYNHFDYIPLTELAAKLGVSVAEMAKVVIQTQLQLEEQGAFGLMGLTSINEQAYLVYLHGPNGFSVNPMSDQNESPTGGPDEMLLKIAQYLESPDIQA